MTEQPARLLVALVGERWGPPVDERYPADTDLRDRAAADPDRAGGIPHGRSKAA